MSDSPSHNDRLADYISRYCDESIQPDELEQLETWLSSDPECLAQFLLKMEIHSALAWKTRSQFNFQSGASPGEPHREDPSIPLIPISAPAPVISPLKSRAGFKVFGQLLSGSPIQLSSAWMLTLLACTLAIGGISGKFLYRESFRPTMAVENAAMPTIQPVAYLASSNGCDWGHQSQELWQVGKNIHLGEELALHDGIAEFRLSSGVALTIEGPAALVLNSPTSVIVQHGRLTTRVPWEVDDFKVLASTCRITACDAEFSVNVAGSEVDIHVFSGEAIVSSSPFEAIEPEQWEQGTETTGLVQQEKDLPSGSWFAKARVPQGRGLALMSNDGMMRVSGWHAAVEGEFATKLSMAGQLPVSPSYVDEVMKSKPVGYWRFESQKDGRIPNEVSSNELQIVGSVHFLGDDANQMIELGRIGSEGYLVSSKPMNVLAGTNYSVEVWVKPSHSHRGGIASLVSSPHSDGSHTDQTNLHAFSLELTGAQYSRALKVQGLKDVYRSRIRLLHRDPPGGDYNTGTSCFSADPYMFRRWQQIAAVKQGRKLRLYVDGKLAATNDDPTFLARNLYFEVGQFIGTAKVLPFVGQLDELSVYKRALSEEEIQRHYKSMNWSPRVRDTDPNTDA